MKLFYPKDRQNDTRFNEWLERAVRVFWFSGFDRNEGSAHILRIRNAISNSDVCQWGVEDVDGYGMALLVPSKWESEIFERPVFQILFLGADSFSLASVLGQKIQQYAVEKNSAYISADPGVSPAYISVALEQEGFHLAAQYFHWVAESATLIPKAKRLARRHTLRLATADDADQVKKIAEETFKHGRFVADPCIPRDKGNACYGQWAANSCRGHADAVFIGEQNERVVGFVTGKLGPSEGEARAVLLGVDDSCRNSGIGLALLAQLFLWFDEKGTRIIRVGTEKPNIEINRIYRYFGFAMENSGVLLHWSSLQKK